MKLLVIPSVVITILAFQMSIAMAAEEEGSKPVSKPTGLMGDWCYIKKRRITKYSVKEGSLFIRGGRSGRTHEAALSCNEAYTECEAKTIRGWGSPVTETLRLDGEKMILTRVWGGAWKNKTYKFTYSRCPKI